MIFYVRNFKLYYRTEISEYFSHSNFIAIIATNLPFCADTRRLSIWMAVVDVAQRHRNQIIDGMCFFLISRHRIHKCNLIKKKYTKMLTTFSATTNTVCQRIHKKLKLSCDSSRWICKRNWHIKCPNGDQMSSLTLNLPRMRKNFIKWFFTVTPRVAVFFHLSQSCVIWDKRL